MLAFEKMLVENSELKEKRKNKEMKMKWRKNYG